MGFFENLKKDFSQAVNDLLQKDVFLTSLGEELSDLEDIETQKSLASIGTKEFFIKEEPKKQLVGEYGTKCFGEENLFMQEIEDNLNLDIKEIFLEPNMKPKPLVEEKMEKEIVIEPIKEEISDFKQEKLEELSSSDKREIKDEEKIDTNEIFIQKEVLNDEKVNNKKEEIILEKKQEEKEKEIFLEKKQEEKEKMIKKEESSFQKNMDAEIVAETSQKIIEVVRTEQLVEENRAVVNSDKTFQKPMQRNNIEVRKSERRSEKPVESVPLERRSEKPVESVPLERRSQKPMESVHLERRSQKPMESVHLERRSQKPMESVHLERRSQKPMESVHLERRSQKSKESVDLEKRSQKPKESVDLERPSQKVTESVNLEKRSQKATGIVKLEERFPKNIEVIKPQETIQRPLEVESRVPVNRKMKKTRQRMNIEEVSVLEELTAEEMNTFDKLLTDTNLLANDKKQKLEDEKMARFETRGTNNMDASNVDMDYIAEALNEEEDDISDMMAEDVTIIAKGTKVVGNISSESSLEIDGTVMGDIECLGRLSVRGYVAGNSSAAEIYVNASRLDGNLISEGIVKVESGTVVIGDIEASSAVVAGAVKGEIDINGPITIDSTAIIKGNIKAKSIQINNGAVVDGHCALAYSTVDIDSYFGKGTTTEVKQPLVMEQQPVKTNPVKVNEPKKEKTNK